MRCRDCGDVKQLTGGVCSWRAGCEHRQHVHEATMHTLNAQLAAQNWQARAYELSMSPYLLGEQQYVKIEWDARPLPTLGWHFDDEDGPEFIIAAGDEIVVDGRQCTVRAIDCDLDTGELRLDLD